MGSYSRPNLKASKLDLLFALGAVLLIAACGGGDRGEGGVSAPSSTDVAAGHDLFKKTCATCHGPNGEGIPKLGKNLISSEFVQSQTDAELVTFLKQGRPSTHPDNTQGIDMPPKGGNPALTDQDLLQIVHYMRSLQ